MLESVFGMTLTGLTKNVKVVSRLFLIASCNFDLTEFDPIGFFLGPNQVIISLYSAFAKCRSWCTFLKEMIELEWYSYPTLRIVWWD